MSNNWCGVEESIQKQPSILDFTSAGLTFRTPFATMTLCVWTLETLDRPKGRMEEAKMINHDPQDTSPFDRPKAGSNLNHERNETLRLTNRRIKIGGCPHYSIVNSAKKHWKKVVTAIALPFIFKSNANAGRLNTYCVSSIARPSVGIMHISGATEDYDTAYDAVFLEAPSPNLDVYSKTLSSPPEDRLKKDARPPTSMNTINIEISGRGLSAPENAELNPSLSYYLGDNFWWENIIGELSQRVDNGEGGYKYALIGNYDIKNLVNSARTLPISVENGVTQGDVFFPSHKLDYNFFNHADLDRNRSVGFGDLEIFVRNWGRDERAEPDDPNNTLGIYVGKDPNDLDAYSDIDRNGVVDFKDFSLFSGEWLWDANDPNTW